MLAKNGQWSGVTWTGANATCPAGVSAGRRRESNDAALWRAVLSLTPASVFHHALFEESFDRPQNPPVGNVLAHQCHEPIMGNRTEVALDIDVHDMQMFRL